MKMNKYLKLDTVLTWRVGVDYSIASIVGDIIHIDYLTTYTTFQVIGTKAKPVFIINLN